MIKLLSKNLYNIGFKKIRMNFYSNCETNNMTRELVVILFGLFSIKKILNLMLKNNPYYNLCNIYYNNKLKVGTLSKKKIDGRNNIRPCIQNYFYNSFPYVSKNSILLLHTL